MEEAGSFALPEIPASVSKDQSAPWIRPARFRAHPQDFPVKGVDTGLFSGDVVSDNAQKLYPGST
jgi:hypothetical protein